MRKNHVWSGLMATALVAGEVQAKGPKPNMSVIRAADTQSRADRHMGYRKPRRGDRAHLLSELRIVLIALQQHVVAMQPGTAGLTAPVTNVNTRHHGPVTDM